MGLTEKEMELRGHAFLLIQELIEGGITQEILTEIISSGKMYDGLQMRLRIALSYVDQKLREKILKGQYDPSHTIQSSEAFDYIKAQYNEGIGALRKISSNAEYSTVMVNLPKA